MAVMYRAVRRLPGRYKWLYNQSMCYAGKPGIIGVIGAVLLLTFMRVGRAAPVSPSVVPAFSASALEYLLKRKDFERFDWYVERYQKRHPDSTILDLLKGYRYFDEASLHRVKSLTYVPDCTGGIPRRYPPQVSLVQHGAVMSITESYDSGLMNRAFSSLRTARDKSPEYRDIQLTICRMAAEGNKPRVLAYETEHYVNKFGCDSSVFDVVAGYVRNHGGVGNEHECIVLVSSFERLCSFDGVLAADLGRLYFSTGHLDSSWYYLSKACELGNASPAVLRQAVLVACIRGNWKFAMEKALARNKLTADLGDLEQAAAFASVVDTVAAQKLWVQVQADPAYCDSSSIARRFFVPEAQAGIENGFFNDSLQYLNYALIDRDFALRRDTVAFYTYKAGVFYATALYDSAAWYNLQLLRLLRAADDLGVASLYNLAAEYYASGNYLMSYLRFLDIYRYFKGACDPAVRYALAVNYEQFGDFGRARDHYRYVVAHPGHEAGLRDLAAWRLRRLGRGDSREIN